MTTRSIFLVEAAVETILLGQALHGDVPWPAPDLFGDATHRAIADAGPGDLLEISASVPDHIQVQVNTALIEIMDMYIGNYRHGFYLRLLRDLATLRRAIPVALEVAEFFATRDNDLAVEHFAQELREACQ